MKIDLITGLLDSAIYLPSPYHNERPAGMAIDMIVVHCIALPPATFGGGYIEAFFCRHLDFSAHPYFETIKDLQVSAHLLINRQGIITQFVPFNQRAWHAGVSTFQGRSGCNDFSIGIELEGSDDLPYEKIQYEKLTAVTQALLNTYPAVTQERIVGHSDIAPGRKTDPGKYFDWMYFTGLLAACSA